MSSQKEWVTVRELARRCKRSHRAAQKAIDDGRIPSSAVRRDARARVLAVEYYQAAACWRNNSSPTFTRPEIPAPPRPNGSVQTSGRDKLARELGQVLGVAFANALLPACAMAVCLRGLDADKALDVLEDLLLCCMVAAGDALGLDDDDDRPKVLFCDDLEDALERRPELLERIRVMAVQFAEDERAARAAGEA
jgi:hypothetical protein